MANFITGIRIVCSIALLFCPALSPVFFALYIAAGVSDMIDGPVARRTNTVSEFGSKLDTIADFVFVVACLVKLIPVMAIPVGIYIWMGGIALIKAVNVLSGYVRRKKFVAVHSVMNRVTGMMLFVLPLTLFFIEVKWSAGFICAVATFAAVQEGYYIQTGRE